MKKKDAKQFKNSLVAVKKIGLVKRDTMPKMKACLIVMQSFAVPYLANACVKFLESSLTAKNACLLLSQSRLFEEPGLMQRSWEVIEKPRIFVCCF